MGTNLFAGTSGNVYLSTDSGTSWNAVDTELRYVTSFAVNETNLFAADAGGGVYLSTDSGSSWTYLHPGNTDRAPSLAVIGTNLFVGAYYGNCCSDTLYGGVYLSTDSGTSWSAVNTGLTNIAVFSFTAIGTNVFAGTIGVGVWRRPLPEMGIGAGITPFNIKENWNIVSVPVTVSDYAKTSLFPNAISNAFYFDAGYFSSDTLRNGIGYWLKFDSAQTVSMTGTERTIDTIDVNAGWNMIGSIGIPASVSNISSIPGGIITSNFFRFTDTYESDTTLQPGKGYWVKVSQAGQLILSSTGNVPVSNRIRIIDTGELPPSTAPRQ